LLLLNLDSDIKLAMNTQFHSTIKTTPYELVFRSKYTLQLYRKKWLSPEDRKTAKLTHEDPLIPPEDESTIPLLPMSRAEEEAGVQFIDGYPIEPSQKTIGPPEDTYTGGESIGVTEGQDSMSSSASDSNLVSGPVLGPLILSSKRPSTLSDSHSMIPPGPSMNRSASPISISSDNHQNNYPEAESRIEDPAIALARDNIRVARDHMIKKHDKHSNIEVFSIGDIVLVKLPRVDRTATDQRKLFARVIGKDHQPPRHRIQTQFGIVDRLFPTRELKSVPLVVTNTINIGDNKKSITLSQAAKQNSLGTRIVISCQCNGQCNTKRCRCFKNSVKCSIHCHREDHDCGNLKALTERTEYSLVDQSGDEDRNDQGDEPSRGRGRGRGGKNRGGRKRARANTAGEIA
jgi:hypothetical protein